MSGAAVQRQREQGEWWTREAAAEYIGASTRKLRRLAHDGEIRRQHIPPAPGRPYQSMVYNAEDVIAYKARASAGDSPDGTPFVSPAASYAPASALPQALELLAKSLAPPPRVKRWLTLDEAIEYSGLPRGYLLKSARAAVCAFALNVGTHERPRYRFDRDQL